MKFIEIKDQYWNVNCIASFKFTGSTEKARTTTQTADGSYSHPYQTFDPVKATLVIKMMPDLITSSFTLFGEEAERVHSALIA